MRINKLKFFMLIFLFICSQFLFLGCNKKRGRYKSVSLVSKNNIWNNSASRTYFSCKDAWHDDRGPGYYDYPADNRIERGTFDLVNFKVIDDKDFIRFEITFATPIKNVRIDSEQFRNWSFQLIDIYIDKDHEPYSGEEKALPGRNVTFMPDSYWENVIVISPYSTEFIKDEIYEKTEILDLDKLRKKIILPYLSDARNRTIVAKVPKKAIGEPQKNWGYQVCILGSTKDDLASGFLNREVVNMSTPINFGGGSAYQGNPNILDILAPPNMDQNKILRRYKTHPNPSKNKLAQLPCLYLPQKETLNSLKYNDFKKKSKTKSIDVPKLLKKERVRKKESYKDKYYRNRNKYDLSDSEMNILEKDTNDELKKLLPNYFSKDKQSQNIKREDSKNKPKNEYMEKMNEKFREKIESNWTDKFDALDEDL